MPFNQKFDAIYSLDVLEHIHQEKEVVFIKNIVSSLTEDGAVIIGMPSIESQLYASAGSKEGHINCKNGKELKDLMKEYFQNVFFYDE